MTTEPKSMFDLAYSCRIIADALVDLATDFDFASEGTLLKHEAGYARHSADMLRFFAKQIEGRKS